MLYKDQLVVLLNILVCVFNVKNPIIGTVCDFFFNSSLILSVQPTLHVSQSYMYINTHQ